MIFHTRVLLMLISICCLFSQISVSQPNYQEYFANNRLRIEYKLCGNVNSTRVIPQGYVREGLWAGSKSKLIDTFQMGDLFIEVFDSIHEVLLYSRGYSNLFKEWQNTERAQKVDTVFSESMLTPFPLHTVRLQISQRDWENTFQPIHTWYFNPLKDRYDTLSITNPIEIRQNVISGLPEENLDIVILSEGYTQSEKDVFFDTAEVRVMEFFNCEPYTSLKEKINVYLVFVPSEETGADDPAYSIYVSTVAHCSFNTFGSDRYLTSGEINSIRNLLAGVPYDQLCVMVNDDKYGGGGIYNYFTIFTANNSFSDFLFLHEFGHSFCTLADEYYTSSVAYSDYFDLQLEPYQQNITTLINFESKWKDMLLDTIPIPTPDSNIYEGVVGVFEGAGYSAKGIYRSYINCVMKSKTEKNFCPVCQNALRKMILFYSE